MRWTVRRPRVQQPPVDPSRREREDHDFWPGFVVAVVALLLLFNGARQATGLETQEGDAASEFELIQAFARGGLQFDRVTFAFDPGMFDDPGQIAAEMDRAARLAKRPLRERYRVNTGAADPCPT
jgi:hypothetical protein